MQSRHDGFMLYGKLGVDFLHTFELPFPNMRSRLQLIKPRPNFCMFTDNPNVRFGMVDCSLYASHFVLKGDYHLKKLDMLAYISVEFNFMETLAQSFIFPARQTQFIPENIINKAPVRRLAIAMSTNSEFLGPYTKNPVWYQSIELRQFRLHRSDQTNPDLDAADKCRLCLTTMNFQGDLPSNPNDNSKTTMYWFSI